MIHDSGNVEGFELCQQSHRIQCPHFLKDSVEGIVYCDGGFSMFLHKNLLHRKSESSTWPF